MMRSVDTPRSMKTFMVIWSGQLISILGSGLTSFALAVWIFDQTGQATPFALTVLFGSLPRILLAPVAGAVADRYNRRRIMILSDTGSAVLTLFAGALAFTGQLAVGYIFLIALVNGAFSAFQEPAYTASITMLVPKKDLTRANGIIQMGQAIDMLLAPLLAGLLFVAIGLNGIILIDFASFFFAIGALLLVQIPQPEASQEDSEEGSRRLWDDIVFGWHYLRARAGLFGLLLYYAMVNFFLSAAAALTGPLVLSFSTASTLGIVQTFSGVGMLVGSMVMSAWGGPKRMILAVFGFIALGGFGLALVGLRPSPVTVAAGLFILMFSVPLAAGPSQAIFQTKVAPDVQGRVFAIRGMIARMMLPLAFLIVGPLADYYFEPWMREGGILANTLLGELLGTSPGRGMGLMYFISGLAMVTATILAFANPRIRLVEDELPDAIPSGFADPAPKRLPNGDTDVVPQTDEATPEPLSSASR